MAINAYTGLMGSGKSYEVVSSVIVPAVIAGRRVVTNIDGIQPGLIREYCIDVRKADADTLGEIVPVTNDDVTRDDFFPNEANPDAETLVKPGDLVAIDEAWKFWAIGSKLKPEHMDFFRMHRHYAHPETGITCDVALMIQAIGDLHRQVRAVVEVTFVTKKLKELGLTRNYRIELYEGGKVTKSNRIDIFTKRYGKAIFPLYQSYAGGKGKERSIDRRQNILSNKRLWFTVGLMLAVGTMSVRFLVGYFNGGFAGTKAPQGVASSTNAHLAKSDSGVARRPDALTFSGEWRIAGSYSVGNDRYVVVINNDGRLRVESPSVFILDGIARIGSIDDQRVTVWTGGKSSPYMGDTQ
ncbi:zonular occludens toxin domain-containing protein [Pandoraea commovens]|uniref:Zonular occludens toxin n=1 Tax=Pandoraea commovens TaxID=2508289 RepID=A0A5E4YXE8_9BURK|nr:zonular occludens toxin domain-containing protein [Pandoraea commovens]VVE53182.1 Zonular occludens toxin [Pandoraea commovens]